MQTWKATNDRVFFYPTSKNKASRSTSTALVQEMVQTRQTRRKNNVQQPSEQGQGSRSTSLALVPPKARKLGTRRKPIIPAPSKQGVGSRSTSEQGHHAASANTSETRSSDDIYNLICKNLSDVINLTKELPDIANRSETECSKEEENVDRSTKQILLKDTESLKQRFLNHKVFQNMCYRREKGGADHDDRAAIDKQFSTSGKADQKETQGTNIATRGTEKIEVSFIVQIFSWKSL